MANTPSPTTNTEWRSGRPSFKAFYPEIFLLTIITIAFIALGAKLSCSAVKKATGEQAPAEVSSVSFFCVPAYAQEADLNEAPEAPEAPATEEPQPTETAETKNLLPKPEQAADLAEQAPTSTDDATVSETAATADTGSKSAAAATPTPAKGSIPWNKILWIWIVCLIPPIALWLWRGARWLVAVYGVEYELRVDEENPRATTFLIKRGIFNKTTDSMHIGAVKDVKSIQSFWQKYFKGGVGTIWLYTNDKTDDKVEMKNMPEPSRIFNAFDSLRKHYWARGGMQLASSADHGEPMGDDDGAFDHNGDFEHQM